MSETVSSDLYFECRQFLNYEAELLDDRNLTEWLDCLAKDISYKAPIRTTREEGAGSEFHNNSYHFNETWHSLKARVDRFKTEYAWSEDPPSRTRRIVGNIRPRFIEDDEIAVRNNLLLFRGQGDTASYDLVAAERFDIIRDDGDGYKITEREIHLDHTILPTDNLSIFL